MTIEDVKRVLQELWDQVKLEDIIAEQLFPYGIIAVTRLRFAVVELYCPAQWQIFEVVNASLPGAATYAIEWLPLRGSALHYSFPFVA